MDPSLSTKPTTWLCYLIGCQSPDRTYVGVTLNMKKRLRQHNQEIVGGAKATKISKQWKLVCMVTGFPTRSSVQKFETKLKKYRRKNGRRAGGAVNGAIAMQNMVSELSPELRLLCRFVTMGPEEQLINP